MIAFALNPTKANQRTANWALCVCAGLCVLLSGCETASRTASRTITALTPYRFDVVQGNFVSKEQVQMLQKGMSRRQVRDVLGTPLVASVFHANRWDYAFSIQRQGVAAQNFRLTVYFKGDVLEQVDSDVLPSESDFAGRLVGPQAVGKLPALQASEEDLKKFAPAASATRTDAPAVPTAPAALPRSYPPLEPAVR